MYSLEQILNSQKIFCIYLISERFFKRTKILEIRCDQLATKFFYATNSIPNYGYRAYCEKHHKEFLTTMYLEEISKEEYVTAKVLES
jgi:hypothetical protein